MYEKYFSEEINYTRKEILKYRNLIKDAIHSTLEAKNGGNVLEVLASIEVNLKEINEELYGRLQVIENMRKDLEIEVKEEEERSLKKERFLNDLKIRRRKS